MTRTFFSTPARLVWVPTCPGVLECPPYKIVSDYNNPYEVDVFKDTLWWREFRTVEAARLWCEADAK